MNSGKKEKLLGASIRKAIEAPVNNEQRAMESALLAALIQSQGKALADEVLALDASDLYFRDHRDIFAAIKKLTAEGAVVDALTLARAPDGDACADALKVIFSAAAVDAATARTYKQAIEGEAIRRQALILGNEFLETAKAAKPADIAAGLASLQALLSNVDKTKRLTPAVKSEAEEWAAFQSRLEESKPGYKTGFHELDKLLHGLKPGLYIIAAPPSAGKTTFLKQLGDQVAGHNKVPVLFFSYEQSADELRIKTLARVARVDNEKIRLYSQTRQNDLQLAGQIANASDEFCAYAHLIKIIEAGRNDTPDRIRLMAQQEKIRTGRAPLIIIDYLQIIPSDSTAKEKRIEIDYLVSDLRRIVRNLEAPVLVASSVARTKYDQSNDPRMDAFKESGGIEFGADVAAVFKVKEEASDGQSRKMELHILKNRNGRRGSIPFEYEMHRDTFTEGTGLNSLNYTDIFDER